MSGSGSGRSAKHNRLIEPAVLARRCAERSHPIKRFTGTTDSGASYEVILIDNSVSLQYIESGFGDGWQSQKTEYRLPMPGFVNIEHHMFGNIGTPDEDDDEPISCRVTDGGDQAGDVTVTLINLHTRKGVEWTFSTEAVYGPLFTDEWGQVLRDIVDGMEAE
jgi:hypothetical protein